MTFVDQVMPRFKQKQTCASCGSSVEHVQCVTFTPFKVYSWQPRRHRRPDGQSCTNVARIRENHV